MSQNFHAFFSSDTKVQASITRSTENDLKVETEIPLYRAEDY